MLSGIFLLCFIVQLYFSLFVHLRLLTFKGEKLPQGGKKPISVIICARNEIANLKQFLPQILDQDYPDFEVVVVNDRSWDGTEEFLEN
ncbi:MAG: glycosyltransferase, partial [Chryseobacterium sp.]